MAGMNILLRRYRQLGKEVDPKAQLKKALRVNTLKIKEEELVARLKAKGIKLEKIPFLDYGYYYESKFSLGATPEYLLGLYYLQDASSQIPAMLFEFKDSDVILDMAASPGSKTTQLSQLTECPIIALDNNIARIAALRNNLERMGSKNVAVFVKDANYVADLGLKFDKILLDAPCSGNFCTDKGWFDKRNVHDFKDMARSQKSLIKAAFSVLNKGGTLVYSTCSLEIEENEQVAEYALSLGLELVPIEFQIGEPGLTDQTKGCLRIWPENGMQPFFIAKFKKM